MRPLSVARRSPALHYRSVFLPLFFSPTLSDVFWRRQLWTSLRRRRQLPLCSHGNPLGGNNFAFIKFKVGLYCRGRSLQQDRWKRNFHTARCKQEVVRLFSLPCNTINGAEFKGRLSRFTSPSTTHHHHWSGNRKSWQKIRGKAARWRRT